MSGLTFLAPAALATLIAVPVIVLFHLRQRIHQEQHVPAIRFWRAAMTETVRSDGFRRPPLTLPFVLRLLIAAAIAGALARPAFSSSLPGFSDAGQALHLVVLIDGSTSMAALDAAEGRRRFDEARDRALAEIGRLGTGDVATVLVLGTSITTMQASDTASLATLTARLRDLPLPGGIADLDAALRLIEHLTIPELETSIVLFSDGALRADPVLVGRIPDPIRLERIGAEQLPNLAVTEITLRSGGANAEARLYARIANFSNAAVDAKVIVATDEIPVSTQSHVIPANESVEVIAPLPGDVGIASVTVQSDDALPLDDSASIPVSGDSNGTTRVLLVSDVPSLLQRALSVVPGTSLDFISSDSLPGIQQLGRYDILIFEGAPVPAQLPNIPLLVVASPDGGFIPVLGTMDDPRITTISSRDPLLNGVDLAGVSFGPTSIQGLDATAEIVVAASEGPLIYRATSPSTGVPVISLAFDLTRSNLPSRVAFPILVANIVHDLAPSIPQSKTSFGSPVTLTVQPETATLEMSGDTLDTAEINLPDLPGGTGADRTVAVPARFPGVVRFDEYDIEGVPVRSTLVVVNAGDPRESDLRSQPGLYSDLQPIPSRDDGSAAPARNEAWPLVVSLCLGLLLVESLAVWFAARHRMNSR